MNKSTLSRFSLWTLPVLLLLISCSSTRYRNLDDLSGFAKEVDITVQNLVDYFYQKLNNEKKANPVVLVEKFKNNTSDHNNTKILANALIEKFSDRGIRYYDPQHDKAALEEIQQGMLGLKDPDNIKEIGKLLSADYFLYGEINEANDFDGKYRLQYLEFVIKLRNVETGLTWLKRQRFLKEKKLTRYSY